MKRRRKGYWLLELVFVVGLTGVAFSLLAVALQTLMRASLRNQDLFVQQATLWRLDLQFRTDVHTAIDASAAAGSEAADELQHVLLLQADGRMIEYRADENLVQRVIRNGEVVVHRDRFALDRGCGARFELPARQNRRPAVCLLIGRGGGRFNGGRPSTPWGRTQAIVGGSHETAEERLP